MLAPPVAQDRLPHALRGKTQPLRRHYPRPSGQGGLTAPPRSRRAPQVESATTDLIQHLLCNSRSVPWGHNPVSCSPRRCGGRLDRVFSRSSRPVQATAGLTHVRTGGVVEPTDWEQVSETRAGPGRLPTIVDGGSMLAAWVVGTANVRRVPVDDTGRTLPVRRHDRTGVVAAEVVAFTAADRQIVEESIEDFVQAAGAPVRPRGWSWWICRPVGLEDDRQFWSPLDRRVDRRIASPVPHPAECVSAMHSALAPFCSGHRTNGLRAGGSRTAV
ncbi:DUF5956 family protein [Kocuria sabuli]|uniref:DUF5956 family protein n=1 Tax=Kocuria sabuli TaxID=3071448 RepID=UPI0034D3D341